MSSVSGQEAAHQAPPPQLKEEQGPAVEMSTLGSGAGKDIRALLPSLPDEYFLLKVKIQDKEDIL